MKYLLNVVVCKYIPNNILFLNCSALRLQRLQPQDSEELWAGVEELWGYRSQRPLFWEGLVKSFKHKLEEIVLEEEGSQPSTP